MGNENSNISNDSTEARNTDDSAEINNLDECYKIFSLAVTDPYRLLKQKNDHGHTILHLATIDGNLEMFQFILRQAVKKLNVDQLTESIASKDWLGRTILHHAAEKGTLEFMKPLFEGEEDLFTSELLFKFLTKKDVLGCTALHLAVQNNRSEMVNYLVNPAKNRLSPQQQLEYIMMTNQDERTALHLAALNGKLNIVKLLNEAELFTFFTSGFLMLKDNSGYTAFQLAILNGHYSIAKFLLNLGDDDVSDAEISLCNKLKHTLETYDLGIGDQEDFEYVKSCLNSSGKILSITQQRKVLMATGLSKRTLIHTATVKNHEKTLRFIFQTCDVILSLEERAKLLMQQDDLGYTAFHLAVSNNHFEIAKLLMKRCSMLRTSEDRMRFWTLTNTFGNTAFHLAVKSCNYESVKFMLEEAKEVGVAREVFIRRNERLDTVFHSAVKRGQYDIIKLLWDSAKIAFRSNELDDYMSARNELKETAFHLAVKQGLLSTAEVFFSEDRLSFETRRKLILATDSSLNTVLHSATNNDHTRVLEWLLNKSAILTFEERKRLLLLTNSNDYIVLHLAAKRNFGNLHFLLKLISQIFSEAVMQEIFRMKTKSSETVFHLAISSAHMRLLLQSAKKVFLPAEIGTLILAKDKDECTVLHSVVKRGDLATAQMILDLSAVSFEQQKNLLLEIDRCKRTVLHWAVVNGNNSLIKFLLSQVQNLLNECDQRGIIKLKDSDNRTALDLIPSGEPGMKTIFSNFRFD